jgi:hypothetical protein
MSETIIVALISLVGSLGGTFGGILVSAKLTNYRLEQLEKKVEKHNNFAERMPVVEKEIEHIESELSELHGYHKQ